MSIVRFNFRNTGLQHKEYTKDFIASQNRSLNVVNKKKNHFRSKDLWILMVTVTTDKVHYELRNVGIKSGGAET